MTGAGRGLGREHALLMAAEGAAVVVNDLGGDVRGTGRDPSPAESVVEEIRAAGGTAVASHHDVADWEQAGGLVELAVESFGTLHVVVNNAGIVRDRTIANMDEDDWDAVIRVHLKGHMAPTRQAMRYWRARAKAGEPVDRPALVHTTSASGFVGNFGQANYGAAKLGVVALMQIARLEGASFGLRSNAVGPVATTRMDGDDPRPPDAPDYHHPGDVSPVVAWLAAADCPANGQLLHVYDDRVMVITTTVAADLRAGRRWTLDDLDGALPAHLVAPLVVEDFLN